MVMMAEASDEPRWQKYELKGDGPFDGHPIWLEVVPSAEGWFVIQFSGREP